MNHPSAVAYAVKRDPEGPPNRSSNLWVIGTVILVVGVLIGAAVGVAIGYVAFNGGVKSSSKDQPILYTVKPSDNSSICR